MRIKLCLTLTVVMAAKAFAGQAVASESTGTILAEPALALVNQAKDLGPAAPDTDMKVTLWLKHRSDADFDKAVDQMYATGSPTYHQWMTEADFAKYAPAPIDVEKVKTELESKGLTVTADPSGLALIARGPLASVENAFHTQIRTYSMKGRVFHANAVSATLSASVANVVESVSGLSGTIRQPMLVKQKDPETGKAIAPKLVSKSAAQSGLSRFVTNQCFKGPTDYKFTTTGAALPTALYFGNEYVSGGLPCGYTPPQIASIYGVDVAAKQGLKGQGQTIVIVDAFGSPTITADANLFSSLAGLPQLDSSNFQIVYPGGMPVVDLTSADQQGWAQEIALDVEWAHAMAPKAKIVLVAALSDFDQDLQFAIQYASVNRLGNVISNSFGGPEGLTPTSDLTAYNRVIKRAAAAGISVQVSSGDDGDFATFDGGVVTVSSPADSPFATSVGGTSLNIPSDRGPTTTGWGNNVSRITSGTGPYDPPTDLGFVFGAGGGESSIFSKPFYQHALPGSSRQQPDVSAVADPFTGVPVIFTDFSNGNQGLAVFGGTSVASPIFSAIWALADQLAGKSLGQAAPIVSQLSSPALFDVVPVTSAGNVFGVIIDTAGVTYYSPRDLVPPISEPKFVSAFYPIYTTGPAPSRFDVLSFGTDSSLRTEKGWDNVTGYGTPGGFSFISEAARYR